MCLYLGSLNLNLFLSPLPNPQRPSSLELPLRSGRFPLPYYALLLKSLKTSPSSFVNLTNMNGRSNQSANLAVPTGDEGDRSASHALTATTNEQNETMQFAPPHELQPLTASEGGGIPHATPVAGGQASTIPSGGDSSFPTPNLVIPEATFRLLVQDLLAGNGHDLQIQDFALTAVQEACEAYMIGVFEGAY